MSYKKLTCRVCGKEYEPCRSANRDSKVFHWQEVACSPDCGAIYLQRINESRGVTAVKKSKHKKMQETVDVHEPDNQAVARDGDNARGKRIEISPVDEVFDIEPTESLFENEAAEDTTQVDE